MPITSLTIEHFRNLDAVTIDCSPGINLFTGANAAGKTSLLETIYVLGRGRSFRARNLKHLIQRESDGFRLLVRVQRDDERVIPVGMEQGPHALAVRVDARPVRKLSDLAVLFPIQWIGGELHRLIEQGPACRRQYLDWGLFHVKPGYLAVWRRYQKLMKQRNAALRTGAPEREVRAWDRDLARAGEELGGYRGDYLRLLEEQLRRVLASLFAGDAEPRLEYRQGWTAGVPLEVALEQGLARDREQGYTRAGPNRADLILGYGDGAVLDRLSRGQQKLFVVALQVAQAVVLKQQTGRNSLFLLDDLGAELDAGNQDKVMALLGEIDAQAFVTAIQEPVGVGNWPAERLRRFHVKHGEVREVV